VELPGEWLAAGALAVEMEAATVLAVAARRGARAACLLAVSDTQAGGGERIAAKRLAEASERVGRAALAALGD
jgi:uridine phosphorylase